MCLGPLPGAWPPGPLPCSVGGGGLEPCVSGSPARGLGPLDLFHAVLVVLVWSPVCLGPCLGLFLNIVLVVVDLEPCVFGTRP